MPTAIPVTKVATPPDQIEKISYLGGVEHRPILLDERLQNAVCGHWSGAVAKKQANKDPRVFPGLQ